MLAGTLFVVTTLGRPFAGAVLGAVAASAGLLVAALTVPPLRAFLGLALPPPLGWALIGAGALVAVLLGRLVAAPLPAASGGRTG